MKAEGRQERIKVESKVRVPKQRSFIPSAAGITLVMLCLSLSAMLDGMLFDDDRLRW